MSTWERATWRTNGALYLDNEHGRTFVMRHGEGRKYWGVQYPDGTYQHSARTQAEAKEQAEAWQPDPTLVTLTGGESEPPDVASSAESASPDVAPAAAVVSAFVDAARSREFERVRKGWGYQDAGANQQKALVVLSDLAALRTEVEAAIIAQVRIARANTGNSWYSNAATWSDVGNALGVTKQSAQAKFGRLV